VSPQAAYRPDSTAPQQAPLHLARRLAGLHHRPLIRRRRTISPRSTDRERGPRRAWAGLPPAFATVVLGHSMHCPTTTEPTCPRPSTSTQPHVTDRGHHLRRSRRCGRPRVGHDQSRTR
jgi:hypothetical protein